MYNASVNVNSLIREQNLNGQVGVGWTKLTSLYVSWKAKYNVLGWGGSDINGRNLCKDLHTYTWVNAGVGYSIGVTEPLISHVCGAHIG